MNLLIPTMWTLEIASLLVRRICLYILGDSTHCNIRIRAVVSHYINQLTANFLLHIDLEWDPKVFWASMIKLIQQLKGNCPVFGVLVVGETGTGKSTLINNLMGKKVVKEGEHSSLKLQQSPSTNWMLKEYPLLCMTPLDWVTPEAIGMASTLKR